MGPSYDPDTRTISGPAEMTPYALAHERAHQWQHALQTRAWRCHERLRAAPYVCRLARLWVEWEASNYALAALDFAGRRDRHTDADAKAGLWSYVRALFWP